MVSKHRDTCLLLRRLPFGCRRDGRIAEASECIRQTLREAVVVGLRHLSFYTRILVIVESGVAT